MTNQIDELMALADEYMVQERDGANGFEARQALKQALEAALKPGGLVAFVGGQRKGWTYLAGRVNLTPGTPLYTTAPPAQTHLYPLSDHVIEDIWMIAREANDFQILFARAIETAVRRQFLGIDE
jgi:hypothetical protein